MDWVKWRKEGKREKERRFALDLKEELMHFDFLQYFLENDFLYSGGLLPSWRESHHLPSPNCRLTDDVMNLDVIFPSIENNL